MRCQYRQTSKRFKRRNSVISLQSYRPTACARCARRSSSRWDLMFRAQRDVNGWLKRSDVAPKTGNDEILVENERTVTQSHWDDSENDIHAELLESDVSIPSNHEYIRRNTKCSPCLPPGCALRSPITYWRVWTGRIKSRSMKPGQRKLKDEYATSTTAKLKRSRCASHERTAGSTTEMTHIHSQNAE